MSKNIVGNIIREGEGERVEFKQSFNAQVMESLSAFANTRGGMVLIGVSDDGVVKGVKLL